MSIRDAIVNATRQTLSNTLAPELVEQLTEEIVQRVAPEMEAAFASLAGFELGRASAPTRIRGATPGQKKAAKPRARPQLHDHAGTDGDAASHEGPAAHVLEHHHHGNGSHMAEPSASQMS